jgi:hypothetical protein
VAPTPSSSSSTSSGRFEPQRRRYDAVRAADDTSQVHRSVRNRFVGLVTGILVDTVAAQVEP